MEQYAAPQPVQNALDKQAQKILKESAIGYRDVSKGIEVRQSALTHAVNIAAIGSDVITSTEDLLELAHDLENYLADGVWQFPDDEEEDDG